MTAGPHRSTLASVTQLGTEVDAACVADADKNPSQPHPVEGAPARRLSVAADVIAAVSFAALAVGLAMVLAAVLRWEAPLYPFWREAAVAAGAFTVVGALIARHLPRSRVGWLFVALGLTAAVQLLSGAYAAAGADRSWAAAAGSGIASTVAQTLLVCGVVTLVLVFPTGRLPSRRWRPVAWATALGFALIVVTLAVGPATQEDFSGLVNPLQVPLDAVVLDVLVAAGAVLAGVGAVGALLSLVARYRAAARPERQQLTWFLWMLISTTALLFLGDLVVPGTGDYAWLLGPASLAAGAAIAVLRYDLYDIDVLVRRSVVYGVLTVLLFASYVGVVQVLAALLPSGAVTSTSLLATAMVAVAFAPVRERTQRLVDRLLHGDRRDPYRALSQLAEQLTTALVPDDMLRVVVETVSSALRSPYVVIEVGAVGEERTAAACGRQRDTALRLPLTYQGQVVGHLSVAARVPGDRFSEEDRRLLIDLSRQAGVAAQAVALTTALQRSRERLVMAREEERRRLRRDLHDGLGPTLTGVALLADAARGQLEQDPAGAVSVLLELRAETKAAIESIRRLVYDLRPPALDELGLIGALAELAARLSGAAARQDRPRTLAIFVDSPTLPTLPAAVEVAAYRIVAEALTNVTRHARASRCQVRLTVAEELQIEVCDDGIGLTDGCRSGVGSTSMRERAAELGGNLSVEPGPDGGTCVRAMLPVRITS